MHGHEIVLTISIDEASGPEVVRREQAPMHGIEQIRVPPNDVFLRTRDLGLETDSLEQLGTQAIGRRSVVGLEIPSQAAVLSKKVICTRPRLNEMLRGFAVHG